MYAEIKAAFLIIFLLGLVQLPSIALPASPPFPSFASPNLTQSSTLFLSPLACFHSIFSYDPNNIKLPNAHFATSFLLLRFILYTV